MTKEEMFALGFIEEDGWLVYPNFRKYGESGRMFMLGTTKDCCKELNPHLCCFGFEERSHEEIINILFNAAFNTGNRVRAKIEREHLKKEMKRILTRIG